MDSRSIKSNVSDSFFHQKQRTVRCVWPPNIQSEFSLHLLSRKQPFICLLVMSLLSNAKFRDAREKKINISAAEGLNHLNTNEIKTVKTDACVHVAARIHALQMKWLSIPAFPWFYPLGRHHNNSTQSPLICLEMYSGPLQPPLPLCWPFEVQMHTAVMGTSVAQLASCPVSHRPLSSLGGRRGESH